MSRSNHPYNPSGDRGWASLTETRWTWIEDVSGTAVERERALENLCRCYWKPLFCYARADGLNSEDAGDAVQGFFEDFLPRNGFAKADRTQGKLRTFLQTCFDNYRTNQWKRNGRIKRWGQQQRVPMLEEYEPVQMGSPQEIYDLHWGLTLRDASMERLRAMVVGEPGGSLAWDLVEPLIQEKSNPTRGACAKAAKALGISRDTFSQRLKRLRTDFNDVLFEEAAMTLRHLTYAGVQEELNALGLLL